MTFDAASIEKSPAHPDDWTQAKECELVVDSSHEEQRLSVRSKERCGSVQSLPLLDLLDVRPSRRHTVELWELHDGRALCQIPTLMLKMSGRSNVLGPYSNLGPTVARLEEEDLRPTDLRDQGQVDERAALDVELTIGPRDDFLVRLVLILPEWIE